MAYKVKSYGEHILNIELEQEQNGLETTTENKIIISYSNMLFIVRHSKRADMFKILHRHSKTITQVKKHKKTHESGQKRQQQCEWLQDTRLQTMKADTVVSDVLQILRAGCSALLVKEVNCTEKNLRLYLQIYKRQCTFLETKSCNGRRGPACLEFYEGAEIIC